MNLELQLTAYNKNSHLHFVLYEHMQRWMRCII
uniref:Uncharacterized protein n=1 Tax=Rhizophora mucronata TaxID=61149 RepID=A0A2P2QWN9_RHIMU